MFWGEISFLHDHMAVHGSRLTGEVEWLWAERLLLRPSGAHATDRENLGER